MTSIPHPLQSAALAQPDFICLRSLHVQAALPEPGCWSAAQLCQQVAQTAAAMQQRWQLQAGDKLALYGPADAAWIIAWHAVSWLGAALLPLPYKAPVAELRQALQTAAQLGCRTVLSSQAPPRINTELVAGMAWRQLATLQPVARGLPERFWPLQEVRLWILSSGSSQAPRWVPLRTAQLLFNALGSALRLGSLPRETWLCCLPLHHIGGLSISLRTLWGGGCLLLHDSFAPAAVAAQLDSGQVAQISLVPRMLQRLLAARPARPFPAALRLVLLGGAAPSAALWQQCRALQIPVAMSWGMTESASQVATSFPGDWRAPRDCGPPLPFTRVFAGTATPLSRLHVVGPTVADGHLRSADLGAVDAQGRVQVRQRADQVIISGGENILPQEVEKVLQSHPAVLEAVVVGYTEAAWGQRPLAYLVARATAPRPLPSAAALQAFCRMHLAPFKVPTHFVWRRRLPRSSLGKLRRGQLQSAAQRLVQKLSGTGRAVRQQLQARQASVDMRRHRQALLRRRVHKNAYQAQFGTDQVAHRLPQAKLISNTALRQARHLQDHLKPVTQAQRVVIIGFTVHHGTQP